MGTFKTLYSILTLRCKVKSIAAPKQTCQQKDHTLQRTFSRLNTSQRITNDLCRHRPFSLPPALLHRRLLAAQLPFLRAA